MLFWLLNCHIRSRRPINLGCGILADPSAPQRKPSKKGLKKHEIQFLTEANLTPRNVAEFCHAGRQRLSGAPLSHDVAPRELRATSAFGGRPGREYARPVQRRSHPNAKAC